MSGKKWLRRLFSSKRKPFTRRPRVLQLERLEDRTLLNGGTWTPLNQTMPSGAVAGVMMLLSDGTVMVDGGGSDAAVKSWYKLTPDSSGSYVNGAWSATAPMNVGRLYFGSNVLPDGRLFVVGGEYSDPNTTANHTNTAEIYDPLANTWTNLPNFPQSNFGDDPTEVLANGQILAGYIHGPQTYLFNPATNSWNQTGTKLYSDRSDEEGWTLLPDGSVLSYDVFSSISSGVPGQAQRYIPSQGQWVDAGSVPVALSSSADGYELGPSLLLPDGDVFLVGANGNTALYHPSSNTWSAGPVVPNGAGADDAAGAILPDGQVLFTADTPLFNSPTQVYDYDPTTNTISSVAVPSGTSLSNSLAANPSFITRMLVLPNGQMLFSDDSNQLWVYSEPQGPQSSWQPTISTVANSGGIFTLTGTQLTGISEGASYGDDNEMSENYPIVQLVNASGTHYFARTTNWTPSVAQGSTVQTTNFTEPTGVTPGAYLLSVSAAGISSNDTLFVQMGAGANNITLRLDPANTSNIQVLQNGSTLLGEFALSSFNSIVVTGDQSDTTTADTLTIDSSNGNPIPAGGLTYDGGGSNNNTLVGPGTASKWQITGHNSGTLNGNITFAQVQSLAGGSAADYFQFSAGGSIDGNLSGGAGVDTLDDIAWASAALNISGPGSTDGYQGSTGGAASPVGGGFDNINSFVTAQNFFVQASYLTPYTNTSDITAQSGSTNYPNSEVEPRIAVDPNNPMHMVAVYQQDRWNDGGSRGDRAAVTFDGGKTWTNVSISGNTVNNGGFWYRNSDPWVSIGPDGTVYAINIDLQDPNNVYSDGVYVNTSHDGGLTWSAPTALIVDSGNPFNDKESIIADPTTAGYAYAVWDRLNTGGGGPTMFSRTTDGGKTWSTPQNILDPNPGQTISNQVVVLPDGTLVNMCVDINYNTNAETIVVVRSTDKGLTWSSPIVVNQLEALGVSDPDNGTGVRQGDIIPDIAVDHSNGHIYVVWQDGRFSGFTHDDIALSESTDGGLTWSAPVKVNQTPTNIPAGDQAAFTPTVAVAADGTVAVSYYDFRFNTSAPGLPTDRWIVYARPWNPTSFSNEQRLSVSSFDMELAPNANGLFVGDYEGMAACGSDFNSFGTFFVQTVSAQDLSSTFFTVTRPPAAIATTTTVVSSANPSVVGQNVTFTATVSSSTGTPTGMVTFLDGNTVLATATLDNTGAASFTASGLALGSHSITVRYSGDNTFSPNTSSTLTQVVNQDNTTTSVTSGQSPSSYGYGVTLTATVTANAPGSGTPTGTVTFLDGNTVLGTQTLSGGSASIVATGLALGSHSITVNYSGDGNFIQSSGSFTQTVSPTWNNFGGNAQHTGVAQGGAQPIDQLLWQVPLDLDPWGAVHYGDPVFTANNIVVVPIKLTWDGNNQGATNFIEVGLNDVTGQVLWSTAPLGSITGATNVGNTIVIQTNTTAGLVNGDFVTIGNMAGDTAANTGTSNQTYQVNNVTATSFTLNNVTGNGTYTGGGTWVLATPSSSATSYIEPKYHWLAPDQPAYDPLTNRIYFPGPGGTIDYISNPDTATGVVTPVQVAFYGTSNYNANPSAYNSSIFINTALTVDNAGNVYFGFTQTGSNPSGINDGGIARISPSGAATYTYAYAAVGQSNDGNWNPALGTAPALSNDGSVLYLPMTDSGYALNSAGEYNSYLVGLNSTTLAPEYSVKLYDPTTGSGVPATGVQSSGSGARLVDQSTAAPMVAPDGTVFMGIFGSNYDGSRGSLLHFSANLQTEYTPGAFGWDDTASIIPVSMVPSYTGTSSYLILSKYNNYANAEVGEPNGGNGVNEIAVLDPYASQPDPNYDPEPNGQAMPVMKQILTFASPSPDIGNINGGDPNAVREWCTNGTAVDPATDSIYVNDEDGYTYQWNLATNTITNTVEVSQGVGVPYTPTAIAPNGEVFSDNGGMLFALGGYSNFTISETASANPAVYGTPITLTTTLASTSGGPTPTGTVTYTAYAGANNPLNYNTTPITLGTVTINSQGVASLTLSATELLAAHYHVIATYSGDSNYASGLTTFVLPVLETATPSVSASANPVAPGSSVTLTATVTPNGTPSTVLANGSGSSSYWVPTGTVTFLDGSTVLGMVTLNPLEDGTYSSSYLQQVSLTLPSLPNGTNSITVVYSGDQNFANGTSTTLPVYVMALTNPGTQNGAAGDNVSLQIQASSLPAGDTWTYSATGLPSGLSINSSSGLITGTITGTSNTYSATITASASQGGSVSQNFTWNVSTLSETNPGTQNNAVGDSVSMQLQSAGLPSGDSWTYSATSLPSGLSLNTSSGLITGTITGSASAYSVTVTASDGQGGSASQSFSWNVSTLSVTNPGTQSSAVGDSVSLQIQSSGLPSGDSWTYGATGLPSGLSFNTSSGLISGTITGSASTYTVTVTASDGQGASTTQSFTWNITTLSVTNPGTQNGAVGDSVSVQVQASGLPSGDSWTYAATGLPSGLSLNTSSGLISGTITGSASAYSVSITASDGQGASATQNFTWNVSTLSETNPGTQNNAVGDSVSVQVQASGLPNGDTWTYTASSLPSGLSINSSTGLMSGTITGSASTYTVTVTASDGQGASATQNFTWNVSTLSETNPGTQNNAVGDAVSLPIQSSGLPSGDSWSYSATGLPSGLSLNTSSGLITGTISGSASAYSVTVTASDGQGASTTQSFTWNITTLSVSNPGTQNGAVGDNVSLQIQSGGLPSGDSWTYAATGLPSGLSLNTSSGLITGTITGSASTYSILVTASDGHGASAAQSFTWNVSTLSVTNPGTQYSAVGGSASLQIQASGLPGGDTWTYSATGLPSGLSVNRSSGLISGTISAAPGAYAVLVTAGDGHGASASQSFTWNVGATTATVTSSINPSVYGQKVTFTATVTPVVSGSGTPSGTVTFYDGATALGNATLNSQGQASLTTTAFALTVGSNSITVSYGGSSSFAASTSGTLTQTVNQASTKTTLTSSNNPSLYGQSVTFTATVAAVSPGSGTPTGIVTFMDGTTVLGTGTLNSSGKATFTTSTLAPGTHSITAVYGGDTNFLSSTSSVLSQRVKKGATTSIVSASQSTVPHGTPVTFTVGVAATAPSSGVPTGTMTFYDGSTIIATVRLDSTGHATLTYTWTTAGTHKIKAVYSGDSNFGTSTSSVLTETVT